MIKNNFLFLVLSLVVFSLFTPLHSVSLRKEATTVARIEKRSPLYKKPACELGNQKKAMARFAPKKNNVVCIAIPKCGTHLLIKCLTLLEIDGISFGYDNSKYPSPERLKEVRLLNQQPPPFNYKGAYCTETEGPIPKKLVALLLSERKRQSFWTHWPHTNEFEQILAKTTHANFLIIRDPRDMVVSYAHMIHKSKDGGNVIDLEKVIIDLITGKQENYVPWAVEIQDVYPVIWEKGLYNFYMTYMPWLEAEKFCLVKFENLVGSQGGGSDAMQLNEIIRMSKHLGVTISEEKAQAVASKLFGGTWTFREGKIGSWRQAFTPAIKEAFKNDKNLLALLQILGYEKGNNW